MTMRTNDLKFRLWDWEKKKMYGFRLRDIISELANGDMRMEAGALDALRNIHDVNRIEFLHEAPWSDNEHFPLYEGDILVRSKDSKKFELKWREDEYAFVLCLLDDSEEYIKITSRRMLLDFDHRGDRYRGLKKEKQEPCLVVLQEGDGWQIWGEKKDGKGEGKMIFRAKIIYDKDDDEIEKELDLTTEEFAYMVKHCQNLNDVSDFMNLIASRCFSQQEDPDSASTEGG